MTDKIVCPPNCGVGPRQLKTKVPALNSAHLIGFSHSQLFRHFVAQDFISRVIGEVMHFQRVGLKVVEFEFLVVFLRVKIAGEDFVFFAEGADAVRAGHEFSAGDLPQDLERNGLGEAEKHVVAHDCACRVKDRGG